MTLLVVLFLKTFLETALLALKVFQELQKIKGTTGRKKRR
jgi:hypothetical protein